MIGGMLRLILLVVDTVCFVPVVVVASLADPEAKLGFRIARYWAWLNNRIAGVRLRVAGLEHLDPARSYVFLSNHRSHVDVLALVEALWSYQLRWVTKKELTRVPGFGWALMATRQIVIDRSDHAQALASLAAAKARVRSGISVVFFPEGTRGVGPMRPFKKGGAVFAIETGTPVVPIAIAGTEAILPPAHWLVRRGGVVRVVIHPPVETADLTLDRRDALLERVRATIASSLDDGPDLWSPAAAPQAAHGG